MPPQKPAPAPGRLSLDASAWPVVHGTRESLDQTHLPTPDTPTLSFWNSQDQAGAFASSRGDGALPSFEEVMDLLLHHKSEFSTALIRLMQQLTGRRVDRRGMWMLSPLSSLLFASPTPDVLVWGSSPH